MQTLARYKASLLFLVLLLGPLQLWAQAGSPEHRAQFAYRGTWELGGTLGCLASTDVTAGVSGETGYTFLATPYVGYFLIHGLEVGASPLAITWNKHGGVTTTDLRMLAAVSYNFFATSVLFPFAEGLAGYTRRESSAASGSSVLSGFTWGGRAGIKISLVEHSVLVVGGQYLRVTLSPPDAAERSGSDEVSAFAGWSIWF